MVSLECAIWELASLLSFKKIQFSVRDGRVKFKVSDSQNFLTRNGVCYQFYSEICGLQEQMGVADFSRMTRPNSEQDLHH